MLPSTSFKILNAFNYSLKIKMTVKKNIKFCYFSREIHAFERRFWKWLSGNISSIMMVFLKTIYVLPIKICVNIDFKILKTEISNLSENVK